MTCTVLRLENINKQLSNYFSLKNINLDLQKGEIHALFGENGAGKSSLMKILCGVYPKDSGNIYLDGKPVNIKSPTDAKKYGITMIYQEPLLFEHFSVAENILLDHKPYLNKFLKIIDYDKMYQYCNNLLKELDFSIDSKTLVKNLGYAERQIIEIAKAYISNARIIVMDEPTSSLTNTEVSKLFFIIRKLKSSGVSIFFISHNLEEIKQIADRITVLRDGEIIGTQHVCNMDTDNIIQMATGLELKDRYPKLSVKIGKEILKISNLHSDNVLRGINFSLRKREILGIAGLAGSGRTKIARSIFGLDTPDAGEIIIGDKKISINSPIDAIKAGIGYITEDRNTEGLFMNLKVHENITVPITKRFRYNTPVNLVNLINLKKEKYTAKTYIYRLGIKPQDVNNRIFYLSEGNKQKILLAKWMISKSKIFLMDEPTKGIDIASKVDVYNLMNELVKNGASIILISSDIDELLGMCDRIMVLYGGRIAATIPRDQATKEKIMYYATGGK